jgi:hypothetical protein
MPTTHGTRKSARRNHDGGKNKNKNKRGGGWIGGQTEEWDWI